MKQRSKGHRTPTEIGITLNGDELVVLPVDAKKGDKIIFVDDSAKGAEYTMPRNGTIHSVSSGEIRSKGTRFVARDGAYVVMHGANELYRGSDRAKAIAIFEGKV
jgi:hypothetical protein